jgi:hypothetical protein
MRVFTEAELRVLKQARTILLSVSAIGIAHAAIEADEDAGHLVRQGDRDSAYLNAGRVAQAADVAEDAIFGVLNTAESFLKADVGDVHERIPLGEVAA